MKSLLSSLVLSSCLSVFMLGCSSSAGDAAVSQDIIEALEVTSFPQQIDKNCRGGQAKVYDECSDQVEIFTLAKSRAKAEGKTTLVSYGAEWCIWCHVFDAYINGDMNKFTYTYGAPGNDERTTHTMRERAKADMSQQAYDLKKFVSDNFIVVHIDYEHSPDGDDVLSIAKARENFTGAIPYVITVGLDGTYSQEINHDDAEIRRDTNDWYRGYDRAQLLEQLKAMRAAALK